jgi:hypothetical protein
MFLETHVCLHLLLSSLPADATWFAGSYQGGYLQGSWDRERRVWVLTRDDRDFGKAALTSQGNLVIELAKHATTLDLNQALGPLERSGETLRRGASWCRSSDDGLRLVVVLPAPGSATSGLAPAPESAATTIRFFRSGVAR